MPLQFQHTVAGPVGALGGGMGCVGLMAWGELRVPFSVGVPRRVLEGSSMSASSECVEAGSGSGKATSLSSTSWSDEAASSSVVDQALLISSLFG